MASEAFSTTLEYKLIALDTAEDIVRFSFIVQKSISHLDLSLSRNTRFNIEPESPFNSGWSVCGSRNFMCVNSEEKCQKLFAPGRSLLYSLHLDLPKGREHSLLEDVPKSLRCTDDSNSPHLGKIVPFRGFYFLVLLGFIKHAFKTNTPKLKIFKSLLNLPSSKEPLLVNLVTRNVNRFIDCFYPEITDSALFKDFIMQVRIRDWIIGREEPKVLEYLLYHARRLGREDLESGEKSVEVFLSIGLYRRLFSNIGPVLKYINCLRFTTADYYVYFHRISVERQALTNDELREAGVFVKRERINYMLQIVWMYMVVNTWKTSSVEATSETLRLLWSSFPDACISCKELETVFGKVFTDEELEDIYEFYAGAVGEYHACVEPRSLQHQCRFGVRRILQENKIWIPDGINQTGLPKPLKLFLKLEKCIFPAIQT